MATLQKIEVLELCRAKADDQLQDLRSAMQKVKESIEGEEKSSAGDKFETARAMAQKEMERLGFQLEKAKMEHSVLAQLDPDKHNEHIQIGSLVVTEGMTLFVAVAMGRINVNGTDVFVISPSSPIGQAILGKSAGDRYKLGAKEDRINSVY